MLSSYLHNLVLRISDFFKLDSKQASLRKPMPIKVYNTLTRQKEPFQTVRPGKVGMYVCGPTVYKPSHVGHMVGPVIFDTIKRYLTYSGYDVTLVINITDVDDKLIAQAQKQNIPVAELAERVTDDYKQNLKKLGVTGVDHMPKATEHIDDIVRIITGLIDKGYAYPAGGDVYFDVTKDPDYGKLCHRDPEQLEASEVSDKKRNPGDFALWKGAKPGEPTWDSPWGPGRPGWHIECSAMSMKYLGQTLDIHGGGLDLQFPHHENELAQSESYTGAPFVRYWMHNGLMKTGDKKMAKSAGNEIVVTELLKRYEPETLRFLLLNTHYRSPIEYSEERLKELQRSLGNFYRFFERFERIIKSSFFEVKAPTTKIEADAIPISQTQYTHDLPEVNFRDKVYFEQNEFLDFMDDDFNTAGAIAILFDFLSLLNQFADVEKLEANSANKAAIEDFQGGTIVFKGLADILGLFREPMMRLTGDLETKETITASLKEILAGIPREYVGSVPQVYQGIIDTDSLIQHLIAARANARQAKDFAAADRIRKQLAELGITLEDRPGGTGWRMG
jgi:cysteinyl-tRNA synthetase